MLCLVFWLAYSFDLDGIPCVLFCIFFWIRWRTWCFAWHILWDGAFGIFIIYYVMISFWLNSLDKPCSKQPLSHSLWKKVCRLEEKKVHHRRFWRLWQLSGMPQSTQKYIRSTSKYPEVPQITKKYIKVPRSTSKYPKVLQSIQWYLKVPRSTSKYLKVP